MDKKTFLLLLDDLIELDPGTLAGDEKLADLEMWDSLAAVGFIAMVDEHIGVPVSPAALASCQTVNDLVALVLS